MMVFAFLITDAVFDPVKQPLQFGLAQSFGATLHTAWFVWRMYHDWGELSAHLAASTYDYEEGSW